MMYSIDDLGLLWFSLYYFFEWHLEDEPSPSVDCWQEENTGLHWAAYAGSVAITEMFLDSGCEFDTPNEHGDRPL